MRSGVRPRRRLMLPDVCVVTVLLVATLLVAVAPAPGGPTEVEVSTAEAVNSTRAAGPRVGFVGNSIGWQSAGPIRHHVGLTHPLVYFDAVIGGIIDDQRPSAVNAVRAPGGPDILLVELGTNDAGQDHTRTRFERDVREFLDAVTPWVDAVVWFDMKNSGSPYYVAFNQNAPKFNAILRRVAADYRKVNVAPYSVWADAAGPAAFASDLVHLSDWGETELGRLARQAADGQDPALRSGPYWDVANSFWAAPAINACAANGFVTGYPDGTYRGRLGSVKFTVSRAQWINMLWRQAGSPSGYPPAPWPDVPAWITEAAAWAAADGIAVGYPDGTFRPDQAPTRAQAASMLHHRAGSPPASELPPHGLSGVPAWVEDAVRWSVANGIIVGFPDQTFRSELAIVRAQAAAWVHGFHLLPAAPSGEAPTTLPPTQPPNLPPNQSSPSSVVPDQTLPPATPPTTPLPSVVPPPNDSTIPSPSASISAGAGAGAP